MKKAIVLSLLMLSPLSAQAEPPGFDPDNIRTKCGALYVAGYQSFGISEMIYYHFECKPRGWA